MPRCPKDSQYKIGSYRTLVKSVAGGGTYLCHIERLASLLVKMRKRSESHFPFLPCGGGEHGSEVNHCEVEPPALPSSAMLYRGVRVNTFVMLALTFSVLYILL